VPKLDPREHHEFTSYAGSLKLNLPFVIDEHENTGVTVTAVRSAGDANRAALVQISTSGALVLKETGDGAVTSQIKKKIVLGGNDSLHIQTPETYDYPQGTEGECVAQANILLRKLDIIDDEEVPSDSLSIDLYISRKLTNVIRATWKSANGIATNLGSSAFITALVAIATFYMRKDVASLIPYFAVTFLMVLLLSSVGYSWYTRDKLIRKRLECNNMYIKLKRRAIY
jgi:hypothetical protein